MQKINNLLEDLIKYKNLKNSLTSRNKEEDFEDILN